MDENIAAAADRLRYDQGTRVDVDDKTILVRQPVKGDPGLTVLRVLGLAQGALLVGAAAHGPNAVAAGVWRKPKLYLARWTGGRRWVSGYSLTGTSRLSDYVGAEGRVPTRLETGNWYGPVPEEISDLFLEAGILLDDPPFPVPASPAPPAPPQAPPPAGPAARSSSRSSPAASTSARPAPAARPARPKVSAPHPSAPVRSASGRATRVCPECRMHKVASQFVAGSDLCVDCR